MNNLALLISGAFVVSACVFWCSWPILRPGNRKSYDKCSEAIVRHDYEAFDKHIEILKRDNRRSEWRLRWVLLPAVVIFLLLMAMTARADSTWAPIEPTKPRVDTLHWSCPLCGHCQPYSAWKDSGISGDIIYPILEGYKINRPPKTHRVDLTFACATCSDTKGDDYQCIFDTAIMSNQSIQWGYWREWCRIEHHIDTLLDLEGHWCGFRSIFDTIFTDDPRCAKPRVDSTFNLLEKRWYYYDWIGGKRTKMRKER